MEIEIDDCEMADVLFRRAWEIGRFTGEEDVEPKRWRTDADGRTYIDGPYWLVCENPFVASLVEAHHALIGLNPIERRIGERELAEAAANPMTEERRRAERRAAAPLRNAAE
jgi:hypothetical protein